MSISRGCGCTCARRWRGSTPISATIRPGRKAGRCATSRLAQTSGATLQPGRPSRRPAVLVSAAGRGLVDSRTRSLRTKPLPLRPRRPHAHRRRTVGETEGASLPEGGPATLGCADLHLRPLPGSVEVVGAVGATVHLRSSVEHTDVVVRLCDMDPRGRSVNVCEGIRRVTPEAMPTNADGIRTVGVDLWPTAHRFLAGHRIRVQVASAAFPGSDGTQARTRR